MEEHGIVLEENQTKSTEAGTELITNLEDNVWRMAIEVYERGLSDGFTEEKPLNKQTSLTALLNQLGFTETSLSQAQVNLPALQRLLNQHPLGKAWFLFLSVSFLKMILSVSCLSTRDIKSPLKVENYPTSSPEQDEPLVLLKSVSPTILERHPSVRSGCHPLVLTSALVLESQVALRKASAIKAFQETVQFLIDGTWGLFASSLIVNALVNLILYPEAYAQQNKALYLVSLPLITGDYLHNALPNPVVYIPLLTIPLILGLINALNSAYRVPLQAQDHNTQIQHLFQYLKQHKRGFWQDLAGWLFSKTLPDAFPVVGLCALLPQVRIQRALEQITFALIWDGRLSCQARTTLFQDVREFIRGSRHLTQLQAISVLADVLSGITVSRLQMLQQAGVEEDTLTALLFIKTEAFRELRYLANMYYLPQEENQCCLFPLHYLRANYDLWRLGYPQHHFLQPFFLMYQGGRLVLSVFLYVSVGSALFTIFQCLAEGKQWTFIQTEGGYICNMCADLPIFYRDTFTIKDCFAGYMVVPRSVEGLLAFIDRFDLSTITSFDLSNQPALLSNSTALSTFLHRLKPKLVNLAEFFLTDFIAEDQADQTDILTHIMAFLEESSVSTVFLMNTPLTQAALDELASILPNTNILSIYLLYLTPGLPLLFHDTSTFAQSLINSEISLLNLNNIPLGDAVLRPIAAVLPKTKIQTLSLQRTNITLEGCIFLAEKIMETSKFYSLNLAYNPIRCVVDKERCRDGCGMVLAKALGHIDGELIMNNLFFTDEEVGAFALAMSATPPPPLEKLVMPIYTIFNDAKAANFSKFIQAIPNLKLTSLQFDPAFVIVPNETFSIFNSFIAVPLGENVYGPGELVEALYLSNITDFGWFNACWYGSRPDNPCPDVCYDGLLSVLHLCRFLWDLTKIKHLQLSCTGVDSKVMKVLAYSLTINPIETLILNFNPIKEGIKELGDALPYTHLSDISLVKSQIDNKGLLNFSNHINQSKLHSLSLERNFLGEQALISLFEGIQGSSMETVSLAFSNMTAQGAQSITNLLIQNTASLPGFWVDLLDASKHLELTAQANNLIQLIITGNLVGDEGATALCQVLPQTRISYARFISDFASNSVNQSVIDHCGVFSGASNLQPSMPIVLLFHLPHVLWESYILPFTHRLNPSTYFLPDHGYMMVDTDIFMLDAPMCPEHHCVVIYVNQGLDTTTIPRLIPTNEMMIASEATRYMSLYNNLLTLCQTFLQSAGQAALLAAFTPLVTDVLHRYGGYELEKAKTISQGLQVSLLFAFSNSKTALTTGFLAHILVSQLTQSPQVIASVTVGTSLVTTILETTLTQSVSLPWLALHMGVGLMGAAVGSRGFQQISKVGQWGTEKVQVVTARLPRLSFWQSTPDIPAVIQPVYHPERPPYHAFQSSVLFYIKDKYLKSYHFESGRDTSILSLRKTLGNVYPRSLVYNNCENVVLISYTGEGGDRYEIFVLPKDDRPAENVTPHGGSGRAALWINRNHFVVLDKSNVLLIKDINNKTKKKITPPHSIDHMFAAGPDLLLLRADDRITLYDTVQERTTGFEAKIPFVKDAIWNFKEDGKEKTDKTSNGMLVAFICRTGVVVATQKLKVLFTIPETMKVKSGVWDENGTFIYSTLSHIKYALPSGDHGIVRTLDRPIYITAAKGKKVFCMDCQGKNRAVTIDTTEYIFKHALANKHFDEVPHMVKNSNLIGQAIIGYLQKNGYPEVALHFVKDEKTRFNLALESSNYMHNIDIALQYAISHGLEDMANAIREKLQFEHEKEYANRQEEISPLKLPVLHPAACLLFPPIPTSISVEEDDQIHKEPWGVELAIDEDGEGEPKLDNTIDEDGEEEPKLDKTPTDYIPDPIYPIHKESNWKKFWRVVSLEVGGRWKK